MMNTFKRLTALFMVAMVALSGATGMVAAAEGHYVDSDSVESDDAGAYSTTFTPSADGVVESVSVSGFEFTASATDGADDVTISITDGSGNEIASETHSGLSDSETHDLSSEFNADVSADTEYTLSVESAGGTAFSASSAQVGGVDLVETTLAEEESVDVAAGDDYTTSVTLMENERITEVNASNFSLQGSDLSAGQSVDVTVEVTDSTGAVVDSGTQSVSEGNTVDLSQAIDMSTVDAEEEHTITVSTSSADAGFTADSVTVTGDSPDTADGGGVAGTGYSLGAVVLGAAALVVAYLFIIKE